MKRIVIILFVLIGYVSYSQDTTNVGNNRIGYITYEDSTLHFQSINTDTFNLSSRLYYRPPHIHGSFKDSSITYNLTQNDTTTIVISDLFTFDEVIDFTYTDTTIIAPDTGHYEVVVDLGCRLNLNDDYFIVLYIDDVPQWSWQENSDKSGTIINASYRYYWKANANSSMKFGIVNNDSSQDVEFVQGDIVIRPSHLKPQ